MTWQYWLTNMRQHTRKVAISIMWICRRVVIEVETLLQRKVVVLMRSAVEVDFR